ncbi:hypothetical protein [Parasphingorhabdus sp.]|uniref:hypothetical protein n=1 Tax=Parasphingorhabdus sp. TaxID=2709688 RepID=UPI00300102F5
MSWVWSAMSSFGAALVLFYALHCWRVQQHWQMQGWFSNGLGLTITAEANPRAFGLAIALMKAFAMFGLVIALFALAISIGWVWKGLGL